MYPMLTHAHSGLRWIVLLLLVVSIFISFVRWTGKQNFTHGNKKLFLFTMIFTHLQFVIGFALYFISPKVQFSAGTMKDSVLRFFAVEHMVMMIIAVLLITFGHGQAKRLADSTAKFKRIFIFYGIGLLIILAAIPWPFRGLGAGWF